jgi:dolichyl-phosphate-mannose-protein mannosyltransferase
VIVVCPKCGAKNRVPDPQEPGGRYFCGKCNTRLLLAPKAPVAEDERRDVPQIDRTDYLEHVRVRKPAASESLAARVLTWLKEREDRNQLVFLLALLALLLHLFVIPYGDLPIFDEHHYVPEARSIIHQEELTIPEHPPLGKLFIACGIYVFGDNPWGWRVPSTIFAVASIVLFYLICRKLVGQWAALLASLLFIFESLTFVISGLAMLNVFSLTFMLLAFLFYLQDRYVLSGVSLALSGVCKMTGLLGGLVILVHWFITKRRHSPQNIGFFLATAFVAIMLLMPLFDFAATREWLNPIDRVWDMVVAHKALTFEKMTPEQLAQASYPWEWILDPTGFRFPDSQYNAQISLTVWILIIPSLGYMVYEFAKKKTDAALFALLWFAATYLLWIPLVLVTDRQSYIFNFYLTLGAVCIAIGFAMTRLWEVSSKGRFAQRRRLIGATLIGYLVLHVILFLVFAPILPALVSYLQD